MRSLIVAALCVGLCGVVTADSWSADMGFKGAGGRLSFVAPDGVDATIGFGGFVDLGTLAPDVLLEMSFDYWSTSKSFTLGEIKSRDMILGFLSKYTFTVSDEKLRPYAGAGLALHFLKVEVPKIGFDQEVYGGDVNDMRLGLDVVGGIGYDAGENMEIVGEIMYRVVSDVTQFVLSGGIVFWFGD